MTKEELIEVQESIRELKKASLVIFNAYVSAEKDSREENEANMAYHSCEATIKATEYFINGQILKFL